MEEIAATRCLDDNDKSFKYKYSNDSHSWIVDYPDKLKPDPNTLKISSKNEDYIQYETGGFPTTGRRKKIIEAFYRKIISEEVFKSIDEDNVIIEEYKSEFQDRFKNPDDMPLPGECLSKNEKLKNESNSVLNEVSKKAELENLKSKYPLYMSAPLTYFTHTTGRENFRKNSTITKSPDKNYDNIEY